MNLPLLTQEEARLGVGAELLGVDGYWSVVLVACRRTGYGVEKVTRLQAPYPRVFVLTNCHEGKERKILIVHCMMLQQLIHRTFLH